MVSHCKINSLILFILAASFGLLESVALAAPAATASHHVRFPLPARARLGDSVVKVKVKNRLVVPVSANLKYRRSGNSGVGLALAKGSAKLKLTSDYVIVSYQVKAIGDGTFRAWDQNLSNLPVEYTLQAGKSYNLDSNWFTPTRWTKFSWNQKSSKAKLQGMLLTSMTLARQVNTPTPLPTPTPTPTATLPAPIATQAPTAPPQFFPTAFPTATPVPPDLNSCPGFVIEGFGKGTTGGCNAPVYTVTTLEDPATAVPGTFRYYAQNVSGPRIIKFAVSGNIVLRKDVTVTSGDLTIDGSDAPNSGVQFSGATVVISASNVILRHLRFLPGPYSLKPGQTDALRVAGDRGSWVEKVVIDHCSMLWATDENLSIVEKVRDITVQWSLVAEGLYLSTHPKTDPHSMGALLHKEATRITMHHNLFAHNNYRNPQLASNGVLEWINNVVYDTGSAAGLLETPEVGDENWLDAIGNFNKMGPSSDWAGSRYRYSWRHGVVAGTSHLYLRGNIDWNRTNLAQEEKAVAHPYIWPWISSTRFVPDSQVTVSSAAQAYEDVLNGAGASLPCRSPVDTRILNETRDGTGGFINYPSERGGWPNLSLSCQ